MESTTIPREEYFFFRQRRLRIGWLCASQGSDVGGRQDSLVLMANSIFPGRHRPVGRPIVNYLGNIFDLCDVFPVVVRQIWTHQPSAIGSVATDAIGFVDDFADRQPFVILHVFQQRFPVRFQSSNPLESNLKLAQPYAARTDFGPTGFRRQIENRNSTAVQKQ